MLKDLGADLAIVIAPRSVVTAPWVIYKCRYGCECYGTNRMCPPQAQGWKETREMLDCYTTAILFRCHQIEQVTPLAMQTARELFLDDYYKVIAFGAGPCDRCRTCSPDHCNFPKETIPGMEACGIDVFATVRANGLEIHTLRERGMEQNCFGLLAVE